MKFKRLASAIFSVLLICAIALSAAADVVPYSQIYSENNPVPEIARTVAPAVVCLTAKAVDWSKETGEVRRDSGMGSAVLIDSRGYFITNHHVVQDADEVEIMLADGTIHPAEIVGIDNGADIAIVYVEGGIDATPVPFGDSDALVVGELAIAIGFVGVKQNGREGQSVTAGIISALNVEEMNVGNFTRFTTLLQFDTAINPGSSGGALLNARGELIGIPTLKYMFAHEGMGFAVPAKIAQSVAAQLIDGGRVVRPRIGIGAAEIEGPEAPLRRYAPAGVQAVMVEDSGPAERAGMINNDIILEIDGIRVYTVTQLTAQIETHEPGEAAHLKVCRYFAPDTGFPLDKYEIIEMDIVIEHME